MNNLQKWGGVAALIATATFVVGLVLYSTLLAPFSTGEVEPGEYVAFLADNQAILYAWHIIQLVALGAFRIVLALALYGRLKAGSPALAQTATAFGLLWASLCIASRMVANSGMGTVVDLYGKDPAQAASVWLAQNAVVEGLGGGNQNVGGLWILLISWAALRAGGLPRALNYLGVVIGVASLLTVVPALFDVVVAVFGLGSIVWFVWVGIVMLRSSSGPAVQTTHPVRAVS